MASITIGCNEIFANTSGILIKKENTKRFINKSAIKQILLSVSDPTVKTITVILDTNIQVPIVVLYNSQEKNIEAVFDYILEKMYQAPI
jgi:hypothetical protein